MLKNELWIRIDKNLTNLALKQFLLCVLNTMYAQELHFEHVCLYTQNWTTNQL